MENVMNNQADARDKTTVSNDNAADHAKQNLYAELDSNRNNTLAMTKDQSKSTSTFVPDAYSIIPPFVLDDVAKRSGNDEFSKAAKDAEKLQTVDRSRSTNDMLPLMDEAQVKGNSARETYDAKGKTSLPGVKARFEGDAPTGNAEVDKAYDFTGIVRDFYQKGFNRDSIDGNGMKFVSSVNYGKNYENAFWNGSQMTYGNPGPESPFKTFMLLDVAGHEITHGVTEKEANETYYGQSGALNESNSDIFGVMINQYAKHQTADQADWLVGPGIWKDGIHGRALRDMLNPGTAYDDPQIGKDRQPADMAHYKKTSSDNGGVHYNSGIPNHAFALFAKATGGYSWEDPGHIWYAARKAAGSDPSFSSFAYQTIEAAKALNKPGEVENLEKAWATVGVKPEANAKDTLTPKQETPSDEQRKAIA